MERVLEHREANGDTFGYDRAFTATKVQNIASAEPAKVPEPVRINPLKSIEDAVEQNDNNFDGIINNLPPVKNSEMRSANPAEGKETERKSVLEQLHAQSQQNTQTQATQSQALWNIPQSIQGEKEL